MKLKKVQIYGFKTFADKTEFDIDADLIAVVGPNGCGKSNIVDAILWGLGETKASHIRAKTNEDVIFAGSTKRRKLGYCEVTLVFDNEDNSLPIDTPEVAVTRKLSRGGESDYRINGRACRLRDVNDLLADSGMGRAGYAIVGQQEIDQALAASPQQRRDWIDEAAGVMRYRNRRVEALRRLEAADEHLARVHDILHEIEKQRKPLEQEAEVARKYKQVRVTLREMESGLLIQEVADAVAKLDDLDEKLRSAARIADEETSNAERFEREASQVTEQISKTEEEIERLRQSHHEAQTAFEHASAALQVAISKLEGLDALETTLSGEAEAGHERVQMAVDDLEKAKLEEQSEANALESLRNELSGADEEARKLTHDLRVAEAALLEVREKAAHQQRIEMEEAHRKERVRAIEEEIAGIEAAVPDLREGIADAEATFKKIDDVVQAARATSQKAEHELHALREQEEAHAGEVRKLLSQIAVLDGRRRGIQDTIATHEGLTQGAKAVLEAVESGDLKGSFTPVGEAVDANKRYALAIDTALGSSVNDLIVKDESLAKTAITYLKENRLGRATFQPVTLVNVPEPTRDLNSLLGMHGVVGLASKLVECDDRHRPVIDSLLASVVVVQDLDTSLRLAKTTGWKRLVTLEGEVVHSSGAVTGGRYEHATGIVQRRAELVDVESTIDDLQAKVNAAEKANLELERERKRLTKEFDGARQALKRHDAEHEEARVWLVNLQHELQATERAKEKLESEKAVLEAAERRPTDQVDERAADERRDSLLRQLAAKSADADLAGQRLRDAEQRSLLATSRRIEAERRHKMLTDSEQQRERKTGDLGPERERFLILIEKSKEEKTSAEIRVQKLQGDLEAAISHKREQIDKNIALTEKAKEAQKNARAMSETAHSAEIQRTRVDSKRTNAVQRLLEEYGYSQEDAVRLAPETTVPEDAAKLVPSLRRELKEMGDVNLGAVEAFERLTERFDELNSQVEDIQAGKAEIMESVMELDRLTKDRFEETFAKLQVAFAEMFTQMFGGGEGEIELLDKQNVLDSGVEIRVTVPGKRRQRLELLSGGERALSATAFLFALLKVKPSPLVILDEVDAPLDGRNVERFVKVVRQFCESSQFILITHNPVTMEEADIWFGVTMQEPGVSTLVTVAVPDRSVIQHVAAETQAGAQPVILKEAFAKN